jgi:hypothetical protein
MTPAGIEQRFQRFQTTGEAVGSHAEQSGQTGKYGLIVAYRNVEL